LEAEFTSTINVVPNKKRWEEQKLMSKQNKQTKIVEKESIQIQSQANKSIKQGGMRDSGYIKVEMENLH